jgi:hypothetical protein
MTARSNTMHIRGFIGDHPNIVGRDFMGSSVVLL